MTARRGRGPRGGGALAADSRRSAPRRAPAGAGLSRREALGLVGIGLASAACGGGDFGSRTRRHYRELTVADKKRLVERLEAEALERTGVTIRVGDPPPMAGVRFAFALDLSTCNGNRRCVEACARENNLPSDPPLRYIRLLEAPHGRFSLHGARVDYDGQVPRPGARYIPVQCQQCEEPPCVTVCPVGATWKEPDGLVVVDYEWCIGCRYCLVACPYDARRFNYVEPGVPPDQLNPHQSLLSNRVRPRGVTEKCTFCLHRVREGRYPACVEACPTGARKFGDLNDPKGEIRRIIDSKPVLVLEEQLGTVPRFFYYVG